PQFLTDPVALIQKIASHEIPDPVADPQGFITYLQNTINDLHTLANVAELQLFIPNFTRPLLEHLAEAQAGAGDVAGKVRDLIANPPEDWRQVFRDALRSAGQDFQGLVSDLLGDAYFK